MMTLKQGNQTGKLEKGYFFGKYFTLGIFSKSES